MIAVNLLPWRVRRRQQQWRGWCLLLLSLLLMSLAPLVAGQWQYQLNRQQRTLLALRMQAQQQASALLVRTRAAHQQREHARQQQRQAQRRQGQLRLWQTFAGDIARTIPADVWLTELSMGEQGAVLRGVSRSVRGAHQFAEHLRLCASVLQVAPGSVARRPAGDIHFSLRARLRQMEEPDD